MRSFAKLSLNQKLGVFALALGAIAVFADVAPGHTVTLNAKEVLTGVDRQEDHVTPQELAAWIVEGRADYRLVDVRGERAFAEYHIPTAESIPLATVADGALGRTEKVVLYGDGGIHAAQAWLVLKGQGFTRVYTLLEGLDAWKDEVLFPVMPQDSTPELQARFARAAQVAKFFGGQPRTVAAPGAAPMALPTAAVTPAVAPPDPARRRGPRPEEEARGLLSVGVVAGRLVQTAVRRWLSRRYRSLSTVESSGLGASRVIARAVASSLLVRCSTSVATRNGRWSMLRAIQPQPQPPAKPRAWPRIYPDTTAVDIVWDPIDEWEPGGRPPDTEGPDFDDTPPMPGPP